MRLGWDNKADAATLTAGSEIATLPAANVQHPHLSRKWHTAAAVKSSYLVFDLGASLACSLLALLGTNLTSAATVRIRTSDADPAVTGAVLFDSGVLAGGVKDGYGAVYKAFAAQTARYWRIDIEDLTVADNLQVGRLFLGPHWQVSDGLLWDWSVTAHDPSHVMRSRGGQVFADVLPQRRVLTFVLDYQTESAMYGNAFALARANGRVTDVLAIPLEDSAYISEQSVWGLVTASEPVFHRGPQIYRQKFQIEETL